MFTTKDYDEVKKTNNHSILYKTNCFGIILLFFNYNHDDYALVQKMKPVDFKLRYPDQVKISRSKKIWNIKQVF